MDFWSRSSIGQVQRCTKRELSMQSSRLKGLGVNIMYRMVLDAQLYRLVKRVNVPRLHLVRTAPGSCQWTLGTSPPTCGSDPGSSPPLYKQSAWTSPPPFGPSPSSCPPGPGVDISSPVGKMQGNSAPGSFSPECNPKTWLTLMNPTFSSWAV